MLDYLIRGATVVDGTGARPIVTDVGVKDGRVAVVGSVDESAATILDAAGLVLSPGFIDSHTHFDAQLVWDGLATPSNLHGVTTTVNGGCGFTLAPLRATDAPYMLPMFAAVEGMPPEALRAGVEQRWESFEEYLKVVEGTVAVNVAFYVGHSALRHYVMGDAALEREASAAEVGAMVELLHGGLEAGGLGFSTTLSHAHYDDIGRPVGSRLAGRDEMIALSKAVGEHEGTTISLAAQGASDRFSSDEFDLFLSMSVAAQRPLLWNQLLFHAGEQERVDFQLSLSKAAAKAGGQILAFFLPWDPPMLLSLNNARTQLRFLPGIGELLKLPYAERVEVLQDRSTRQRLAKEADSPAAGVQRPYAAFERYRIGTTFSPENEGLTGRLVGEVASERGDEPFSTLVDIALRDELRTEFWAARGGTDADWAARSEYFDDPNILFGGSDAGAHVDFRCGAAFTTSFMADVLRGRRFMSLEAAIHHITGRTADILNLRERGRIAEGFFADLVLFDPETIDSSTPETLCDLPAGAPRLVATSTGIARVLVNGVETVVDGVATGATPGSVLRSNQDTVTRPFQQN